MSWSWWVFVVAGDSFLGRGRIENGKGDVAASHFSTTWREARDSVASFDCVRSQKWPFKSLNENEWNRVEQCGTNERTWRFRSLKARTVGLTGEGGGGSGATSSTAGSANTKGDVPASVKLGLALELLFTGGFLSDLRPGGGGKEALMSLRVGFRVQSLGRRL